MPGGLITLQPKALVAGAITRNWGIQDGNLELFPRVVKNRGDLPKGIRLTLIAPGSYVLDKDLNPVHLDGGAFCDQWQTTLAINEFFVLAAYRDSGPEARGYWQWIAEAL